MAYDVKNADLAKAIQNLGEEQALVDLVQGTKNREYRKTRNMRQQAVFEIAKKDPRFKAIMDAATAKATATGKK